LRSGGDTASPGDEPARRQDRSAPHANVHRRRKERACVEAHYKQLALAYAGLEDLDGRADAYLDTVADANEQGICVGHDIERSESSDPPLIGMGVIRPVGAVILGA
jgi:hypothetical protein